MRSCRNLDNASIGQRRPSLLIDLLANYGDSALIALEAALGGDNR